MSLEAKKTSLPSQLPGQAIICPTADRWFAPDGQTPGFLPRWITSMENALRRDSLQKDSVLVIGDKSDKSITDDLRAELIDQADGNSDMAPIYVLTPETRAQAAQEIIERTNLRQKIVAALTTEDDYAKQRTFLDVVLGGVVLASNQELRILTADDDVVIPPRYVVVKEGALPILEGLRRTKNSQVIFQHDGKDFPPEVFEKEDNPGIHTFFENLGETVGQIRKRHPDLRATESWIDTMHQQLQVSLESGVAQFVVTYSNDNDIPDADNARIIGATSSKSGMPDYRTVQIAKMFLQDEFPQSELARQSFPFGPKQSFAFRSCTTNVDSAAFSRLFNEKSIYWPWWFISDLQISLDNPYVSVPAKYRADNEFLPVLLQYVFDRTGEKENYLYLAGIPTQVLHKRATTGYRPDLPTGQAPASLVGNIAALEAARMLQFDPQTGLAHIPIVDADYKAPEEHSARVFEELVKLATICAAKQFELNVKGKTASNPDTIKRIFANITQYARIQNSLAVQLAGWDFIDWKKALDEEIRNQLSFYREVLEAMPSVIQATGELIREGKYPVVQFIDSSAPKTSYPGRPRR